MPLFGQLAEVTHIIAALLHFAAAVAAFANPPAGQTPVVVLVCEALALTLHDQTARAALQQDYGKQCVRGHHAFALVHDVLANLIRSMMDTKMKHRAVNEGKVSTKPAQEALQYILNTLPLCISDLGRTKLDLDLVTFAADTSLAAKELALRK